MNLAKVHITTDNINFLIVKYGDFKKKRIVQAIIVVLIGAFIFWQISLLFVGRNKIKEDGEEIMKFLKESEERTQQKY